MTLDIHIARARSKANLPAARGSSTDTELVDAGNRAQDMVSSLILQTDEAYYDMPDQTLGFVANQEEYDLPRPIAARKISKVTRTDVQGERDLMPIRFQDKNLYENIPVIITPGNMDGYYYYLRGEKLGLKPTPKQTIALNIRLNYQQLPHELHWAQIKTPATGTFKIPTATSGAAPIMKAGRLSTEVDYYVNARIRIITGAAMGLERRISAYDPTTQTCTFDTAITSQQVTDITNADYVILSPLAKEYQAAIYWAMVSDLGMKSKNVALKEMAESELNKILNNVERSVVPRNVDIGRYVKPPNDFDG